MSRMSSSFLPNCAKLSRIAMCRLVNWLAGGKSPRGKMYQHGPLTHTEKSNCYYHRVHLWRFCVFYMKYLRFLPLWGPSPFWSILENLLMAGTEEPVSEWLWSTAPGGFGRLSLYFRPVDFHYGALLPSAGAYHSLRVYFFYPCCE